ncbi:MAG: dihydroneopterin aldolase [Gammaproteobacteria bacterium]|nr:dihydroneopterin aldolase [Gammaproteobacteria bacterium]
MDRIFLTALATEAVIGIFDREREIRQRVVIDLEMLVDLRRAAATDSIAHTLNYRSVAKRVLAFVEASRFHLVETLAEQIARLVVTEFGLEEVQVTLHKPGAIRHSQDVGVIIRRRRADYADA